MRQKGQDLGYLKTIRVIVSILFFAGVFLLFVDLNNSFDQYAQSFLYIQFIPSLMKFLSLIALGGTGFIIITLLTFLFGRIYCSSICPLGTLQDVIIWITRKFSRKNKKKKFHDYSQPRNWWRYSFLGLVVITLISGVTFFTALLDPYSNFGRFVTQFAKPVIAEINNLMAKLFEHFGYYGIKPVEILQSHFTSYIFPILMLAIIMWLAVKYGRLYCNTVCPVGTLLGLFSRLSLYKIRIDPSFCNACGQCVYDCKAGCIDKEAKSVDFSRCIACYNCLTACDKNAFYYQNTWLSKKESAVQTVSDKINLERRGFMAGLSTFLLSIAGIKDNPDTVKIVHDAQPALPTTIPENKKFPVVPPGAVSIRHFNDHCTACSLCISACPNNVLQPSFLQYGLQGMIQPYMDYHSGFCNYECKICADVCPTGAIINIPSLEDKKVIQIGKSHFIKENCVVYTDNTDCGACSEHCPTKAVNMVPYEDTGLFIPEINEDICIGCGACEYPCPTRPYRAIYVDGNPEHLIAEKPEVQETEEIKLEEDEFPF